MCGIAGFIHRDASMPVDELALRNMTSSLRHRGPDDVGQFIGPGVALGHRRLAILDPACGKQPMSAPLGNVVLTFNGEIYNFVELRDELAGLGFAFRTSSDTEVLLSAYLAWGTDMFPRLNGVWAFALWDSTKQILLLSRDRVGEKPLYYADMGSGIVFASEPKAILRFGHAPAPALGSLNLYLSLGYVPGEDSFFTGIKRVKPGEYLMIDRTRVTHHRYWSLPIIKNGDMRRDRPRVYADFAGLLSDAVRIRMRSDVPYGAFLSGGLDSTSIVLAMNEHTEAPVSTFTIGFPGTGNDERALARLFADAAGTHHHEQVLARDQAMLSVRNIVDVFDEPFGDSSAAAVGLVSQLAVRHVKMALSGDGGDEALSGYDAYRIERLLGIAGAIPRGMFDALVATAQPVIGAMSRAAFGLRTLQRHLATARMGFCDRLATKASWIDQATLQALFPGLLREAISPRDYIGDSLREVSHLDGYYQLMHFHFNTSLPDDMLTKVDRMSMAHSLEVRAPFLDHRLIELLSGVDKSIKTRGLKAKTVLRETVGRHLPRDILAARKRGFSLPVDDWFRSAESAAALHAAALRSRLPVDLRVLRILIDEHRSRSAHYGGFLWILLVLFTWFDVFE